MAEDLRIDPDLTKEERYIALLPQVAALTGTEDDLVANMANIAAALKETFSFWWVGFYLVKGHELVLGPFQGPVACTRIAIGKGVCGMAWKERRTVIVDDVDQFPGHIACSSFSRSEIVLPLLKDGEIMGVLDVDSEHLSHFDETDAKYLQQLIALI